MEAKDRIGYLPRNAGLYKRSRSASSSLMAAQNADGPGPAIAHPHVARAVDLAASSTSAARAVEGHAAEGAVRGRRRPPAHLLILDSRFSASTP